MGIKFLKSGFNLFVIYVGRVYYLLTSQFNYIRYRRLIRQNSNLENSISSGKRCFVVGAGPSLMNLDLSLLKDETIIGMNSVFLSDDVKLVKNKIWIIIDYFFLNPFPIEAIRNIEKNVGNALYILPVEAEYFVKKYDLFQDKDVRYVSLFKTINNKYIYNDVSFLKLHRPIFKPIGSAETAIICSQYLGFGKIYLLGLDSDWFAKSESYNFHFYRQSEDQYSIDFDLPKDWIDHKSMVSKLRYGYLLYSAYHNLYRLLKSKGIDIYNASGGGLLDVFPHSDYGQLFEKSNKSIEG